MSFDPNSFSGDLGDLDFTGVERTSRVDFAGECICIITDAEISPSNDGKSRNLWMSLVVEEPAVHEGKVRNKVLINIGPNNQFQIRNFLEKVFGHEINGPVSEVISSARELISMRVGVVFARDGKFYNVDDYFTAGQ